VGGPRPRTLAAAALILAMTAPVLANPGPGDVFREHVWMGPFVNATGWQRVTDPEARQEGAHAFLPNPVNRVAIGDLDGAVRAEVVIEQWGGHAGTSDKRLRLNGNRWIAIPEPDIPGAVGADPHPESYQRLSQATVPLPLDQLRQGDNTFEFTSGGQITFDFGWGQWGVYGVTFRIYYDQSRPHVSGRIVSPGPGETFSGALTVEVEADEGTEAVDVVALYDDFDYEGNGLYRQWHYTYRYGRIQHHVGVSTRAPFTVTWDTDWVPDQPEPVALMARLRGPDGLCTMTEPVAGLVLERPSTSVQLYRPFSVPPNWQTRAGKRQACKVFVPHDLTRATSARLMLASWSGAHADAIGIDETKVVTRVGRSHDYSYDEVDVPLDLLHAGTLELFTEASTEHHGIEVLWPGICLKVQYDVPAAEVEPAPEARIYGEGLHDRWEAVPANLAVDTRSAAEASEGSTSMELIPEVRAWRLELLADPVLPLSGYESLHLALLPAEVPRVTGASLYAYVGERPIDLLAGEGERQAIDLARPEWQVVEIPLAPLGLPHPYLGMLRLMGNFTGRLYVDDVRLVPPLGTAVGESDAAALPAASTLLPAYPNPFNGGTAIPFDLRRDRSGGDRAVRLAVYTMTGQLVTVLTQGPRAPGRHLIRWDGRDAAGREAASGVYVYRLEAGGQSAARRLALVR